MQAPDQKKCHGSFGGGFLTVAGPCGGARGCVDHGDLGFRVLGFRV